ncbi:MAG TPA: hypothetical protein VNA25_28715 [Phycisphaerae bacterium]|nr:hypothetical protein [Phycisphaerae bacterium]
MGKKKAKEKDFPALASHLGMAIKEFAAWYTRFPNLLTPILEGVTDDHGAQISNHTVFEAKKSGPVIAYHVYWAHAEIVNAAYLRAGSWPLFYTYLMSNLPYSSGSPEAFWDTILVPLFSDFEESGETPLLGAIVNDIFGTDWEFIPYEKQLFIETRLLRVMANTAKVVMGATAHLFGDPKRADTFFAQVEDPFRG